MYEITSEIIVS